MSFFIWVSLYEFLYISFSLISPWPGAIFRLKQSSTWLVINLIDPMYSILSNKPILSYHILLFLIMLYIITSNCIISNHILFYQILSYSIFSLFYSFHYIYVAIYIIILLYIILLQQTFSISQISPDFCSTTIWFNSKFLSFFSDNILSFLSVSLCLYFLIYSSHYKRTRIN